MTPTSGRRTMGSDDQEAVQREEDARRREADAEAREAERHRDREVPPSAEDPDEESVIPADTDQERHGVVRPPEGR
jgi:hypothetical protein